MVIRSSSSKDGRFVRLSFIDGDVGGIVGGISNVISAGIGAAASRSAANKYLQGVQETNAMNLQLAREQQAWDLAQWNRQNEYNSPSAQMARWQAAGLSPHSFVGTGSTGVAASLQSPTLANQVAPGDLSGYAQSFAQSIQQGVAGANKVALDWKQMNLNEQQI